MAEAFKNIYNETFFNRFVSCVHQVVCNFDGDFFLKNIYNNDWKDKELKQRMRHITYVLKDHLSDDFKTNVDTIIKLIPVLEEKGFKPDNLEYIFFPDFIEVYGIDDFDVSISAFETSTQFVSCEFAVRPFIINQQPK